MGKAGCSREAWLICDHLFIFWDCFTYYFEHVQFFVIEKNSKYRMFLTRLKEFVIPKERRFKIILFKLKYDTFLKRQFWFKNHPD